MQRSGSDRDAEAALRPIDETARPAPALPDVDCWLVDGFNALHAVVLGGEDRGRFWDRAHRERLIAALARGLERRVDDPAVEDRAGAAGEDATEGPVDRATGIVLVFDGHRPVDADEARPAPGLQVVFAPSADEWIVKRAREAAKSEPAVRIGVVSNDRKVAGRCRHVGAKIVAPAEFMAHLRRDPAAQAGPSCGGSGTGSSAG